MNLSGKRLLLGTAIAAAALGVGGVAYAAGNDPAPDQGYVTVEEGPATPGSSTGANDGTGSGAAQGDGSSAAPQGRAGTRDGKDCPDKAGSGGAEQGAQPTQPQGEQPDVAGNA